MTADHAHELEAFLKSKRWFGDKTRAIRGVRLRERVPVRWPNADRDYAVARADVETDGGRSTYQLLLGNDARALTDALDDEQFRRGLIDAFAHGAEFEHDGVRWIVRSEAKRALIAPPGTKVVLSKAEQSNSSLIVEGLAILKLFRKVEPGVHPDVEVTRFLTVEREFVHVPVLLGTIQFQDASGTTVAGMLQELVPGAKDGWSYALQCTKAYFGGANGTLPFQEEARELGSITRALHDALASGAPGSAFEKRIAESKDLESWIAATRRMADKATGSLTQALDNQAIPEEHLDTAHQVMTRANALGDTLAGWGRTLTNDAGARTRTHGDYHLGQVIRSAADRFLVIDFEGEPARPLSERRALQSPLRDVAGMLRSFAYLGAVAASEGRASDDRRTAWERATREAFLDAYFAPADTSLGLLPRDHDNARRLIALFETEKAFYELQYELDHRPDWAWIPLRGIQAVTE